MNEKIFWEVIGLFDWSQSGDDEAVLAPAFDFLKKLSVNEIIEFEEILAQKLYDLDRRDIAKACYDGDDQHISGDDFLYSRCVVVANGKELFDEVINNPELMPSDVEFESLLYLALTAPHKNTF